MAVVAAGHLDQILATVDRRIGVSLRQHTDCDTSHRSHAGKRDPK
jgi:hypothetical protein